MTKLARFAIALVALAYLLAGSGAHARVAGDLGFGLYQGADIRGFQMYPTISFLLSDDFDVSFGLNFSTSSQASFGFLMRGSYAFKHRGDATIHLGGVLEVFDRNSTSLIFAPVAGIDYNVTSDLSLLMDVYPFAITTNGSTEVLFLEGRFGATLWF
jgi:hypothetical protein